MADKKGDKKEATPDDIMSPGDMKPILAQAKRGNLPSCAIALTKDKDGVILVDKRKKPKKLMSELKRQAADIGLELDTTSLRFGRAMVDSDVDATLLTIMVNKDASGAMRPKLLAQLKKAGFSKLEIIVDAGLENESEEEDAPAGVVPAAPGAPPQMNGAAPAAAAPAPDAMAPPPPAPPAPAPSAAAAPPGAASQADLAAMTKTLTELVKRMIGVISAEPARGAALKPLATEAQTALRSAAQAGGLAPASVAIEAFKDALDGQQTAPAARGVNVSAIVKASKAWLATRQKIENDIGRLRGSFAEAFKEHEQAAALAAGFEARIESVMGALDQELGHRLADVTRTTDPAEHDKVVVDAKKIIKRYEDFLASDPTIAEIDSNPLVPLAIQKTLTATLEVLSRAVA